MQDDRIDRYQHAAKAARDRAMTARDPRQWVQIADSWDRLAHQIESLNSFPIKSPDQPHARVGREGV